MIKRPRNQKYIKRANEFKEACDNVKKVWSFLAGKISEHPPVQDAAGTESTATQTASSSDMGVDTTSSVEGRPKRQCKREIRRLAKIRIETVKDLLAPIMHILAAKLDDEQRAYEATQALQK